MIQKANNAYDLILQNDTNTNGCTQWFNFKVTNKQHNFVARFNIVNLVLIHLSSTSRIPFTTKV